MTATPRVTATAPTGAPPAWAVLERALFDALDEAWRVFAARYCEPDGRLRYHGPAAARDGADDFYEAFFNWPVLYRLGGADDLLDACKHHWAGVTAQLTELGYLVDEFERGYDWFHQGESMLLCYGICAADPRDQAFRERAHRFADLYLPGSPAGNYDPATDTIRAPHNGAGGPRWGVNEEWAAGYGADLAAMRPFGLPLRDVPGVDDWSDLADPANAARMGAAMDDRLGRGDTAVNLAATSLAVNAWLYGHQERYREWALRYIDAWRRRARQCGVLPDNVGPSGEVGEAHGGRWYGGPYGWMWPHGLYSVGAAAVVAAVNTVLLTGETDRLDIGRGPLDAVEEHAVRGPVTGTAMSISDRWLAELGEDAGRSTLLVPNRRGDQGWFDFQPPQLGLPAWLWQIGALPEDAARLERLRAASGYDWRTVRGFRNKEEAGHEAPWLEYLRGANPGYPQAALAAALGQVGRRMALIGADRADPARIHVHHWQRLNPVLTEALLQLTTGTPQVLYNGGLLPTRLLYHDADRGRPGLPPQTAALVDTATADRTGVELVNLGRTAVRRVVVQAGGFAEHRIDRAVVTGAGPGYPGDPREYTAPPVRRERHQVAVDGPRLEVVLPPGRSVRLDLHMTLRAARPAHQHVGPVPTGR